MTSHPQDLHPDTITVSAGRPPRGHDSPVNPALILSSTFHETGVPKDGDRVYGRMSNPTWDPFEEALAELEGAELPALVFSAGLAAAAAALSLIPTGGTLVIPRNAYGGSILLAEAEAATGRFTLKQVDIADTQHVLDHLHGADMLWIESPTNPMLEVAESQTLTEAAHAAGAVVVVDNTFNTPLISRPLDYGADIVLHSVTKYLAGHSDVVLGALITSNVETRAALKTHRTLHGGIAGPFEVWLALRGLRTLALRMDRSQANAMELATRLASHPAIAKVRYPGLEADPGHQRAKDQFNGFGGVVSIELESREAADSLVNKVRLWLPATSLGGVESLIERRRRQPGEPVSVPESLVRLSVGIENVEDLWADIERALSTSAGQTG